MRAAVLFRQGEKLTVVANHPLPKIGSNELLVKVSACGICRTDIHILDGDLHEPRLPLVLGHEIVGRVISKGENVRRFSIGDRVGTGWLGEVDNTCPYCKRNQENLCDQARFTGYTRNGGFAEYCSINEDFAEIIPSRFTDEDAAPLMCAGLIGFRTYKMTGLLGERGAKIGIYGFGAAAHIAVQLAPAFGHRVFAFTRPGDTKAQEFANSLGCEYVGDSMKNSPEQLDAALIFASAGELVVQALRNVRKGGIVVCGGIHMSDIPSFPYVDLWGERTIKSVANLTRFDAKEFLDVAEKVEVRTVVHRFALDEVNYAIDKLRQGLIEGAAILKLYAVEYK